LILFYPVSRVSRKGKFKSSILPKKPIYIYKQPTMKKIFILQIAIIAFLFSACSSTTSLQETRSSNQSAQSNNQIAQSSGAGDARDQNDPNLKSSFANLESEGTNLPMERSTEPQAANEVCPHPDKPCTRKDKEFAEWELSFRLPAKITPNKTYSSAPFYAVMLKTYKSVEDCDGGEFIEAVENERKQFQNLQLERKVFASYGCPNMDAVNYEFEGRWDAAKEMVLIDNFIAVYAGKTAEEAEVLRRELRDEYPEAVVKRMTVNWERIEQ
jgi:hypothetical protein